MIEFVFVFDLMFKLQIALLQSYHAHWYVLTWIAVVQEIYAVLMVFLGDIGFVLREGGNPSVSAWRFDTYLAICEKSTSCSVWFCFSP